jgi:hypothetical protein
MPPDAARVSENAVPTAAAGNAPVEMEGAGGTVMVAVAVFVESATDVAVTVAVCEDAVAAGAV